MAPIVDDKMLELLVPAASYFELSTQLADRYRGLAQAVTFPVPTDSNDDVEVALAVAQLKSSG